MKRRKRGYRSMTVRLPVEQLERLDRLAEQARHSSRADLIRVAIDHLLPQMEADLARFLLAQPAAG